ncbi:unnamed protein product [Ilex paraguariensis]|uniref:F-box domain-containing protein n=1 Tax=Ilex paraguariensis TaxID=185542 RepID=A0ABC8T4A8_9AQUA
MSSLPIDIMADLLSRLPVTTLLQLRCVSKCWRSLIDSPNFIKMHLHRSKGNTACHSLVFNSNKLYSSELDSLNFLMELNHPLKNFGTTTVMGSCNGLLLLANKDKGVYLWNMSTRKHHKLPDTSAQSSPYPQYLRYMSYGFGYDSNLDDYKVVRIVQFYYEECDSFSSEVKVYSLKSNSWRTVQQLPYYLCFTCQWGAYACGALHWAVKQRRDPDMPILVVAFDIGTEEYRLLSQPEYLIEDFDMGLEVLGGCICITCSYDTNIDIWVMKDYGVNGSWTKFLVVIPPRAPIREYMKPLAYSKGGEEILLNCDGERFFWYDLALKTFKEATICGSPFSDYVPYSYYVVVYIGSLVPVADFGEIDHGNQHGQEKKQQKNRRERDDFLSEGFKLVL